MLRAGIRETSRGVESLAKLVSPAQGKELDSGLLYASGGAVKRLVL